MNVNEIAALSGVTTEIQGSSQARTNQSGSERDLFMTLLVAQLKNQDPLAPQDGTQFVAQLAQFNSLDQLIEIRQLLEEMRSNNPGGSNDSGNTAQDSNSPNAGLVRQSENVLRQGANVLRKGESVINKLLKVL